MNRKNSIKLYNILLPLWFIIFIPSWLWLLLIPANYLIDRIVLQWSLGGMEDKGLFCRKHNWKICLAGFLGDFVGAITLYFISIILVGWGGDGTSFLEKAGDAIMFEPFANILAVLIVIAAIALSGFCIYKLDIRVLGKTELDSEQIKRAAIRLALFTAPYLYLIPGRWFY